MLISAFLAAAAVFVTEPAQPGAVGKRSQGSISFPVGPGGQRLYVNSGDPGEIECDEECREIWRPLTASAGDMPVGNWQPVEQAAGFMQWTYKGRAVHMETKRSKDTPQYLAILTNVWRPLEYERLPPAIATPASARIGTRGSEFVMTDYRGHTLYTFSRDRKLPACREKCLNVWPALQAPALAQPIGSWTPVERPDGIRQWAFRGKLVYTYSDDLTAEEARGDGAGGVWKMLTLKADGGPRPRSAGNAKTTTDRRISP